MGVSTDGEREATVYLGILNLRIWILQRAASQHRFLRIVERYSPKFLPVTNKLLFHDDFVYG